ncbi:hypothetical protein ACFFRR_010004 [Megaselia abdita]
MLKLLLVFHIFTAIRNYCECHGMHSIMKLIKTNYTFGELDSPVFRKYEFVAPMDKQIQIECAFEETPNCSTNYISVGIEGKARDMVEYCEGNFTEMSAFRRMTVLTTLRQPYKCTVKVMDRKREICGASISRKIVDGIQAAPNEFPYYAALYSVQIQAVNCGGTLINHNSVLTAAHCFESDDQKENIEDTWIYLGLQSFLKYDDNPYIEVVKPKQISRHSQYNRNNLLSDDIAIVTLEKPVEYSFGVSPVCMPDKTVPEKFSKSNLVILGLGQKSEEGESSNILLKAQVDGYSEEQCNTYFKKVRKINRILTKKKFCVISPISNNMDTCPGDSGGPVIYKSNKDYLVGIVSAGLVCGIRIPSINTRVSLYDKWILSNVID